MSLKLIKEDLYTGRFEIDASPLENRRDAILATFQDEPLSKAEALELIDELAEIQNQIERNN